MAWRPLPDEQRFLYSQVALRLLDDLTESAPTLPAAAELEVEQDTGLWRTVDRTPAVGPSGILTYPGLSRTASFPQESFRRYRVKVSSVFYRPAYLREKDGVIFDRVHPYDDRNPPAEIRARPKDVWMLPSPAYPLPGHIRVIRGVVVDGDQVPVANAEVNWQEREFSLSDELGAFALPLRWPALKASVTIDAMDHRTGRTGEITVELPADLSHGHLITVN